ncbi:hypothetical protein E4U38_004268 [Claviceps purpurea]|nr:hypothetical protein E4U38_004268 [Claviceps purpurea]
MSFSITSQNIHLREAHLLYASCLDSEGNWQDCSFDLNDCLGNDNGSFVWDGDSKCWNFGEACGMSAFHVHLYNHGADNRVSTGEIGADFMDTAANMELDGSVLTATLLDNDGEPVGPRSIDLNERITNSNGQLMFVYYA